MRILITILIIHSGIVPVFSAHSAHAQSNDEIIQKLTAENRNLTQENNLLKKRIRMLEEQLGEDNVIGDSYTEIKRTLPQDMEKNDTSARDILNQIAEAAEHYAKDNYGSYPGSIELLKETSPPYIKINYCDQTMGGFVFTCDTSIIGYTITATPVERNFTGSTVFTITTGGILAP